MDCAGNEKRIQALFSELSLEEQSRAPQFAHVWTRAQSLSENDARSLRRPLAVWISVLVVTAACSFAVWSWYRFTPSPSLAVTNQPGIIAEASRKPELVPAPESVPPRRRKTIARQTHRKLATDAALLSSWRSPTQSFMTSPTTLVPSSLPQLNQSVKDLESFLPRNNEVMKESNQ